MLGQNLLHSQLVIVGNQWERPLQELLLRWDINPNSNQIKFMEVDINEPVSKFFNVFLRMFQLGGQVALAYWAVRYHEYSNSACGHLYLNIASYLAYAMVGINFLALLVVRCSQKFPRVLCFLVYLLDLIICGAFIAQYFVLMENSATKCAADRVVSEFTAIEAIIFVVISFMILCGRLGWAQRYTNSPGNLVWAPLMLAYSWNNPFPTPLIIIGVIQALISLASFFFNIITCGGPTTKTKKVLIAVWIISLLLMIGCEVYAVLFYLGLKEMTAYKDIQAKKTLAIFIVVNFFDLLFWVWGLKSLSYENGDPVRGKLYEPDQENQLNPYVENQNPSVRASQRGTYQPYNQTSQRGTYQPNNQTPQRGSYLQTYDASQRNSQLQPQRSTIQQDRGYSIRTSGAGYGSINY